jgi:hypothetical protein
VKVSAKHLFAVASGAFFILFIGCRSHHVMVTVENHTGQEIQLVEVDYPSASFGEDAMTAGQVVHYSIQIRDSGPVKVQYMTPDHNQLQITGPVLHEKQEGALDIVLLPGGKAEFQTQGLKD